MPEFDVIRSGRTVSAFLADPVMSQVFQEMQRSYFLEWMGADNPQVREMLWSKARGLRDLQISLQAVADAGEIAERNAS